MNEFTDEEIEQYEEELEDLDVKALLVAQTAELREMRSQLQLLTHALIEGSDAAEETPQYECVKCGTQHSENELREHARRRHNVPAGMDLDNLFNPV